MKYTKEQKQKASKKAVEIMTGINIPTTKSSSSLQVKIINELSANYKKIEELEQQVNDLESTKKILQSFVKEYCDFIIEN